MAKSGGRGKRRLSTRKKGRGKAGGRWAHGFVPKNAVARQLKRPLRVLFPSLGKNV